MSDIGLRLREERELLGLNQDEFGELGGVKKNAQSNYENGSRKPSAEYLELIANAGVDVFYVLTGKRHAAPLQREQAVIGVLADRGVAIEEDRLVGGREITFSSVGMAWLLNYLEQHQVSAPQLSWRFLVELAAFEPKPSSWRELRIKTAALPVYDGDEYIVYFYYLNGSPPRRLQMFRPSKEVARNGTIEYDADRKQPFRIRDDQLVLIQLTNAEHDALMAGEVLVVDPLKGPPSPGEGRADQRSAEVRAPVANIGGSVGQIVQGAATFNGSVDIAGGKNVDPKKKR